MPADRWQDADAYERFIGRWSRRAADQFLAWLSVPAGATWVDVGCGTGALSGQIVARTDPARVTGVDPSAAFVEAARDRVAQPVAAFEVGQADRLPLDSGSADVVVSGLVLNFVPDVPAALDEAARVAGRAGRSPPTSGTTRGGWSCCAGSGTRRSSSTRRPRSSTRVGAFRSPRPRRWRRRGSTPGSPRSSSRRSTSRPGSRTSTTCGCRSRCPSGPRPATSPPCRPTGATRSASGCGPRCPPGPRARST